MKVFVMKIMCVALSVFASKSAFSQCIKKDDKLDHKTIDILQSVATDYGFKNTYGYKFIDIYPLMSVSPNKKRFLIVDLRGCDLNCSSYLVELPQKKVLKTFLPTDAGDDICISQSQQDGKIYINGDLYIICDPAKPYGAKFLTSVSHCESNKN